MDEKKPLQDILASPNDLPIVKNGYMLLIKIDEITKQNLRINPAGLTKIIHEKDLDEYKNDKKIYARKLTDRSNNIGKRCRELLSLGLIEIQKIKEQTDSREIYYVLTKTGKELLKNHPLSTIEILCKKHKIKPPLSNPSDKVNDYHAEKIRDLIRKVINEIPDVYEYFVSSDPFDGFQKIYAGDKLPFEDDVLYSDLSNHLGKFISFQELKDRIEEFKQKGAELPDQKNSVNDVIRHDLLTTLSLEYDPNCVLKNTFSSDLVDWVYKGIVHHMENGRSEDYQQLFSDPFFQTETTTDTVTIRMGVDLLMKVSKGSEDCKQSQLKEYMKKIEKQISFQSVLGFMVHRKELIQIRDLIIESLTKESMLPGYSGKCIYS